MKDWYQPITASELKTLNHYKLNASTYRVYMTIRIHRNNRMSKGGALGRCWMSVAQLAEFSCVGVATVSRCTSKLDKLGLIRLHRTPRNNEYHTPQCRCVMCRKALGLIPARAATHKRPETSQNGALPVQESESAEQADAKKCENALRALPNVGAFSPHTSVVG